LKLNDKQLASVKVVNVGEYLFPVEKSSVGSIDFNEDLLTQVFTPYQGKIIGLFAKVGDEVKKGQTLFTIDSPDLLAADSNLIAAAGVLELTSRNLTRLQRLYETRAVSQKDLEQAVSDQQTAAEFSPPSDSTAIGCGIVSSRPARAARRRAPAISMACQSCSRMCGRLRASSCCPPPTARSVPVGASGLLRFHQTRQSFRLCAFS
jgi:hypothetical protein